MSTAKRKPSRLRHAVAAAARAALGQEQPAHVVTVDGSRAGFEAWRRYALSLEVYLDTRDHEWRDKYTAFVRAASKE